MSGQCMQEMENDETETGCAMTKRHRQARRRICESKGK